MRCRRHGGSADHDLGRQGGTWSSPAAPSRSLDIWVVPDLVASVNVPVFLMFRDFCFSHSLHPYHITNPRWPFCRVLGRYATATRRYSPPVTLRIACDPSINSLLIAEPSPWRTQGTGEGTYPYRFTATSSLGNSCKSTSGDRERHSLACRCLTQ
jgi:hypothetical protein